MATIILLILLFHSFLAPAVAAQEGAETAPQWRVQEIPGDSGLIPPPVYLCALPNINDYPIFGNAGWDGNWYVGYNLCWIEKLPPAPPRNFRSSFVGVKLGRAKTHPASGKPSWEKEPIPGNIYIAISSTPAWKSVQRFHLVSTEDIPLEGDMENALEGVGEARWFWAEVPMDMINFEGPNFISVWSPASYFISRDSAPILCGGWGAKGVEVNTWLNDEIQGAPPINPDNSLKTPISVFEPAIAIKLIPEETTREIRVFINSVREGKPGAGTKVIDSSVQGYQIDRAWLEVATVTTTYRKIGRYLYNPPYTFTLNPQSLPRGNIFIRVAAEDEWANKGNSAPFEMIVEAGIEKKAR